MKEILRLQAAIFLLASHLFAPCFCSHKSYKHFDARNNFGLPDNFERQLNRSVTHIFKERESGLSSHHEITLMERAPAAELHEVIFVIHQKNMEELKRILYEVSDPTHLNYGNHMNSQDVAELTKNDNSQEKVIAHLKVIGAMVVSQTLNGECITARASIIVWEEMLNTEFYKYSHQPTSDENGKPTVFTRAQEYSVPDHLDEHVASVLNTIQLPAINTKGKSTPNPLIHVPTFPLNNVVVHEGFVTPGRVNEAYRIESNIGHPRATQAVYETSGQYYSAEDLISFQEHFELPIQSVNESVGSVTHTAAACKNNYHCVEGNLDVQYITAIAQTPTLFYYTDLVMTLFLVSLVNKRNPPLVISFSYGISEFYISKGEYELFNSQAIKLGVMGVTLLFATGDDGVANAAARNKPSACAYAPFFPASSPYVTSVGATQGVETRTAEIVCQSNKGGGITGGGGFSTYYPRPSWQKSAVSRYFNLVDGTSKAPVPGYNRNGRGYPDISAAGANYIAISGSDLVMVEGTSVSTPVVAGMVSLVNAARFRLGRPPVGWINPVLYTYSKLFVNDVVEGRNNCTASETCCKQGFEAAPGWDPASGLGSLDLKRFKAFMMSTNNIVIPSERPTTKPSLKPTVRPSLRPTIKPSRPPTRKPTYRVTRRRPTPARTPSRRPPFTPPRQAPTKSPTPRPSQRVTPVPSRDRPTLPYATVTRRPSRLPSVNQRRDLLPGGSRSNSSVSSHHSS